jgi:hypothetical protein
MATLDEIWRIQRPLCFCRTAYMWFTRVSHTRVELHLLVSYYSLHWDLGEEIYLKFMKLVPGEHSTLLGFSIKHIFSVWLSSWTVWTISAQDCTENLKTSSLQQKKPTTFPTTHFCLTAYQVDTKESQDIQWKWDWRHCQQGYSRTCFTASGFW